MSFYMSQAIENDNIQPEYLYKTTLTPGEDTLIPLGFDALNKQSIPQRPLSAESNNRHFLYENQHSCLHKKQYTESPTYDQQAQTQQLQVQNDEGISLLDMYKNSLSYMVQELATTWTNSPGDPIFLHHLYRIQIAQSLSDLESYISLFGPCFENLSSSSWLISLSQYLIIKLNSLFVYDTKDTRNEFDNIRGENMPCSADNIYSGDKFGHFVPQNTQPSHSQIQSTYHPVLDKRLTISTDYIEPESNYSVEKKKASAGKVSDAINHSFQNHPLYQCYDKNYSSSLSENTEDCAETGFASSHLSACDDKCAKTERSDNDCVPLTPGAYYYYNQYDLPNPQHFMDTMPTDREPAMPGMREPVPGAMGLGNQALEERFQRLDTMAEEYYPNHNASASSETLYWGLNKPSYPANLPMFNFNPNLSYQSTLDKLNIAMNNSISIPKHGNGNTKSNTTQFENITGLGGTSGINNNGMGKNSVNSTVEKPEKVKVDKNSEKNSKCQGEILMLSDYAQPMKGVSFNAKKQAWLAYWTVMNNFQMRKFPIKKYGFRNAKRLAIQCRLGAECQGTSERFEKVKEKFGVSANRIHTLNNKN